MKLSVWLIESQTYTVLSSDSFWVAYIVIHKYPQKNIEKSIGTNQSHYIEVAQGDIFSRAFDCEYLAYLKFIDAARFSNPGGQAVMW